MTAEVTFLSLRNSTRLATAVSNYFKFVFSEGFFLTDQQQPIARPKYCRDRPLKH